MAEERQNTNTEILQAGLKAARQLTARANGDSGRHHSNTDAKDSGYEGKRRG